MALRLGSVALRWMPDAEREAFRSRELDFLLTLPSRIRLWFQSKETTAEGSGLEELVTDLARRRRSPQERNLWLLHPDKVNLVELVARLGLDVYTEEAPPDLREGQPRRESVTSLLAATGQVSFLQPTVWPPYVFPGLVAPLFTFDPPVDILLDLFPLDRSASVRLLRQRVRAFKPHREEDPLWGQSTEDTEALLAGVLQRTNRLFRTSLIVAIHRPEQESRLERFCRSSAAGGLLLSPVPFGQRPCLRCFSEDLDADPPVSRMLDATSLTHLGLFEWATRPVPEDGILLGYDPDHRSLISYNRPAQANPSALVLGTPGSGKSTFAKVELLRSMDNSNGRSVIFDPEGEYGLLVRHMQGSVVPLSEGGHPINPLACLSEGDVEGKMTRLPGLIAGDLGNEAAHRVRTVLKDLYQQSDHPTLSDLEARLPRGDPLRTLLWPLVQGPLRGLGSPGEGVPEAQVLSFDLSQFDADTVGLAVPYLLELLVTWARVSTRTGPLFVTLDEIHVFLRDPAVRTLLVSLLKRARKTGVVLTGITQNVGDFFLTDEGALLVANAGTVLLFRQSPEDMRMLIDRFRLSDMATRWLERVGPGEGLIITQDALPIMVPLTPVERSLTDTTPTAFRRRVVK